MYRLACLMTIAIVAGCARWNASQDEDSSGPQTPRVMTIKPERKRLVRTIELSGRAEAYEVAPLYAKVTGYVERVSVDIGDAVQGPHGDTPGTTLCELLVPELKEELAEKEALIAQSQAEMEQTDAMVKIAEAAVRSADAKVVEAQAAVAREQARFEKWQSEYQRISQLAANGVVTQKVADETRSELETADAARKETAARIRSIEAARDEATAGLEKAKADTAVSRSKYAVCQAEKRRIATMLDYSVIRAPFNGIVVERNVHTGHLVQSGGTGAKLPVLTVMRADPIRVFLDIPESDAIHISQESKVELRIPSLPGTPYVGKMTRTSWSLNTTSRTLTGEVDVPNADSRWRPGQYVMAILTVAELDQALAIPKTAIVVKDKQTSCLIVEEGGKVARRDITIGIQAGNDVEIQAGLDGSENVISLNPNAFREGQVVEIATPAK